MFDIFEDILNDYTVFIEKADEFITKYKGGDYDKEPEEEEE